MTAIKLIIVSALLIMATTGFAQSEVNWTEKQLMEPSALAASLKEKKDIPVIISVGPGAPIPQSLVAGMVNNREGVKRLQDHISNLPKDKKIVIYCGCCPYEHCPNVRPAINTLKQMNFTNYFLLDLPKNIKTDWIDKGYPVTE